MLALQKHEDFLRNEFNPQNQHETHTHTNKIKKQNKQTKKANLGYLVILGLLWASWHPVLKNKNWTEEMAQC